MNPQIFNDEHFRKAIQWTVCLIVFCCIVSQIMMQLAGGERDERCETQRREGADKGHLNSPLGVGPSRCFG